VKSGAPRRDEAAARYHGVPSEPQVLRSGDFFDLAVANVFGVKIGFTAERFEERAVTQVRALCWPFARVDEMATECAPSVAAFWRSMLLSPLLRLFLRRHTLFLHWALRSRPYHYGSPQVQLRPVGPAPARGGPAARPDDLRRGAGGRRLGRGHRAVRGLRPAAGRGGARAPRGPRAAPPPVPAPAAAARHPPHGPPGLRGRRAAAPPRAPRGRRGRDAQQREGLLGCVMAERQDALETRSTRGSSPERDSAAVPSTIE